LRNPVDRAHSNYLHCRRDGREPSADFAEALEAEDERIAAKWSDLWHYKHQGLYAQQISRYLDLFDASQLLILLYDDFLTNPRGFVQAILDYLGVDPDTNVDMSVRHNRAGVPKNAAYMALYKSLRPYSSQLKEIVPQQIRHRLRSRMLEQPQLSRRDRIALAQEYQADILLLSKLIDRDLSAWLADTVDET
jgi:hypothetical protein